MFVTVMLSQGTQNLPSCLCRSFFLYENLRIIEKALHQTENEPGSGNVWKRPHQNAPPTGCRQALNNRTKRKRSTVKYVHIKKYRFLKNKIKHFENAIDFVWQRPLCKWPKPDDSRFVARPSVKSKCMSVAAYFARSWKRDVTFQWNSQGQKKSLAPDDISTGTINNHYRCSTIWAMLITFKLIFLFHSAQAWTFFFWFFFIQLVGWAVTLTSPLGICRPLRSTDGESTFFWVAMEEPCRFRRARPSMRTRLPPSSQLLCSWATWMVSISYDDV